MWQEIGAWMQMQNGTQVILGGDFNATLDNSEKQGGSQTLSRVQLDFQAFVEEWGLREMQTKNGKYTFTNWRKGFTHIAEKLDRFFLGGIGDQKQNILKQASYPSLDQTTSRFSYI